MNNYSPEQTVLVDMDGVVAQYDDAAQALIPTVIPGLNIVEKRSFYIEDDYPEEYRARIKAISREPGFIENLPVEPGTLQAIDVMLRQGYMPRICTSLPGRHPTAEIEKRAWVERELVPHFGMRIAADMVITYDKAAVQGVALIEDRAIVKNADKAVWTHVIFDQPWNEGVDGLRIPKWNDLNVLLVVLEECGRHSSK